MSSRKVATQSHGPGILITDLGCPSYATHAYQVLSDSSQPSTPLPVTRKGVRWRNALLKATLSSRKVATQSQVSLLHT